MSIISGRFSNDNNDHFRDRQNAKLFAAVDNCSLTIIELGKKTVVAVEKLLSLVGL